MTEDETFLDRMFTQPSGLSGRIGAMLMAHMNTTVAANVVDYLEIGSTDAVLEIGFGPGAGIEYAAETAEEGYVAGVDVSELMVERATRRNEAAIDAGLVDLRQGSVDDLPFEDETFDAAFSINSLYAWPDQHAGLAEIHRVLHPEGIVAIVLTKHAGRPDEPLEDLLRAAGFDRIREIAGVEGECIRGRKPEPA